MKAAVLFSQKPSFLLLDRNQFSRKVRHDFDRRIMLAYQILQDESCPTCGTPVWLGHNEDNTLGFDVEDATCYACSELESAREKVREEFKGREHMRFGVTEYVVPRKDMGTDPYGKPLPPGPLPSRTEAFEAMELRRAELAQVAAAQQEGIF